MLTTLIFVIVVIALTIIATHLIFRWGSRQLTLQVEARLRAAEQIVREKQVPDDWLAPYRQRAEALRGDADGVAVAKLAEQARKKCLREIDILIRFYEHSNLVDSTETRMVLLAALRERRTAWLSSQWHTKSEPEGGIAIGPTEADPPWDIR